MRIQPLLTDITDQLKEAQIKLGFGPSTVKLYYAPASLAALTGSPAQNVEALAACLSGEDGFSASPLGQLSFAPHEDRVEVTIPQEGVRYVHEQVEASPFLQSLIGMFAGHHHTSMAQVVELFESQQSPYVHRQMPPDSEFDSVLYFQNGQPDGYCYFFKEEMGHLSYHRFRPEDAAHLLTQE